MPGWVDNLPEWLESRKLAWGVLTVVVVTLLAITGTVLAWLGDVPTALFEQAMYLVTGTGTGGTITQAAVDRARVQANPAAPRTWNSTEPTYDSSASRATGPETQPAERRTPPSIFGR